MMPGRRPRLLLFGWHRQGTGFTRVLSALVPVLAQHYEVTWLGVGYRGAPTRLGNGALLLPTNLTGGDLVGAHEARLNWEKLSPDLVFALNDIWYLEHYPRELGFRLEETPMVGYLPLDGDIADAGLVAGLAGISHLVTYTRHAAGQLRDALADCGLPVPVSVAGHGVDLGSFHPAADSNARGADIELRMKRAASLFGLDRPAWVVLNASRPDPRKRIDLTLEGFARFARNTSEDVRLCLHQAIAHDRFVGPMIAQARALGIEDRILWWPPEQEPLGDAALNRLYNACAVGLNTSMGEGFGLVSFEHAATGAPQLLPAHEALCELWGEAAWLMRPVRAVTSEHSPLVMGEVEADAVAEGLGALYGDDRVYRHYSMAGMARTRQPDLQWTYVADRLVNLLQEKLIS